MKKFFRVSTRISGRLIPVLAAVLASCWTPQAFATPIIRSTADLAVDASRIFGLERSRVVRLALPREAGRSLEVELPFEDGAETVMMIPYSIRSASHQVLVQGADGTLQPVASAPVRTLRGFVDGVPDSYAAGSLLDDGLHLRILLPDGEEVWVEPIARRVPGSQAGDYVVYKGTDVQPSGGTCEARLVPAAAAIGEGGDAGSTPATGEAVVIKVAELSTDADYEYYTDHGSSPASVQARIESVINAVNIQYERDVAITHVLGTMIVRTAEPDPYTSTNAETLLNQFRDHWNANHTGVQRDVAHLFTGKSIDGGTIGIAWIGVICNGSYGYGLSESDFNNNFSSATDLTAHELGHNWNSGHCDCTSHTMNPYITSANLFHPTLTIPTIVSFRDSRTCLTEEVSQPPEAPTALGATTASDSQINLAWTDNDTTGLGFDIERSPDGATWGLLASVGAATTTYQDTGLPAGSSFYYRVFAYNDVDVSDPSNVATATTDPLPEPPAAPSSLVATAVSASQIDLAWLDLSPNENGFKIERSGDGGTSWAQIDQTGPNVTAYSDTGLNASTTYAYRVRAFNGAGDSDDSNVDSATTDDPPAFVNQVASGEFFVAGSVSGSYPDTWADGGPVLAVTERQSGGRKNTRHSFCEHVLAFDVQAGQAVTAFVHAWGGSAEDAFRFAYSTDGGSTYTDLFEAPLTDSGTVQSFALSPATSGSVLIRVTDTDQSPGNTALDTVYIDHAYIRTDLADGDPPGMPIGLVATALSAGQVSVTWSDVAIDEFGYELERSPDGSAWGVIASLGPDAEAYDDLDVQPASSYYYRARAFNGAGYSEYSNTDSALTPDGPGGINLTSASGYKVRGLQHVDLTWTGGGTIVDIKRDGVVVATVANTGAYTNNIDAKGGGSYTYEVCETDGGACSNSRQVTF